MTSKEQKERKCCYYLLSVMNSQNETIASLQADRDLMKIKYHDEVLTRVHYSTCIHVY